MKKLISYFLQGLLYTAPLGITLYIMYYIFTVIDGLLQETLHTYFDLYVPGLGILILILLLIVIGFLGSTILAHPFKLLYRRLLKKIPILGVIHSAFEDLFSAFVGKEKKFNQPVLVKVNTISNLEKLGFLTEKDLSKLDEKDKVAVYFPHSYNFSGELFIVPADLVKPIPDLNPADVMKFIVSGGVAGWNMESNTPKAST